MLCSHSQPPLALSVWLMPVELQASCSVEGVAHVSLSGCMVKTTLPLLVIQRTLRIWVRDIRTLTVLGWSCGLPLPGLSTHSHPWCHPQIPYERSVFLKLWSTLQGIVHLIFNSESRLHVCCREDASTDITESYLDKMLKSSVVASIKWGSSRGVTAGSGSKLHGYGKDIISWCTLLAGRLGQGVFEVGGGGAVGGEGVRGAWWGEALGKLAWWGHCSAPHACGWLCGW